MAALAAAAETPGTTIAIALIGGHGELFVQRFAAAPLSPFSALESLSPERAAAMLPESDIFGSGAPQLVAARGTGVAHERWPRAADVILLPEALITLAPNPIYGRSADATAMKPAA